MGKEKVTWTVNDGESEYIVVYNGINMVGNPLITINGKSLKIKYRGMLFDALDIKFYFKVGNKQAILYLKNKSPRLFIENLDVITSECIDNLIGDSSYEKRLTYERKMVSARRSFFSIIILSIANVFLLLFNASISFPFSIELTTILVAIGKNSELKYPEMKYTIISVIISGIILLVYFIIYLLTKRKVVFSWIATGLYIIDVVILVLFAMSSTQISDFLVDFAFHGWAAFSLISLSKNAYLINKVSKSELYEHAIEV